MIENVTGCVRPDAVVEILGINIMEMTTVWNDVYDFKWHLIAFIIRQFSYFLFLILERWSFYHSKGVLNQWKQFIQLIVNHHTLTLAWMCLINTVISRLCTSVVPLGGSPSFHFTLWHHGHHCRGWVFNIYRYPISSCKVWIFTWQVPFYGAKICRIR